MSKQLDVEKLVHYLDISLENLNQKIEGAKRQKTRELNCAKESTIRELLEAVQRGQFDAEPETSHPYQPVVVDENGRAAFKGNKIIEQLFENGLLNLNKIAQEHYDSECYLQLIQLLGYTLSGSACLQCMTDDLYEYGQREAERLGVVE